MDDERAAAEAELAAETELAVESMSRAAKAIIAGSAAIADRDPWWRIVWRDMSGMAVAAWGGVRCMLRVAGDRALDFCESVDRRVASWLRRLADRLDPPAALTIVTIIERDGVEIERTERPLRPRAFGPADRRPR